MAQIPTWPVASGYCSFWLLLSIGPRYQRTRHYASPKIGGTGVVGLLRNGEGPVVLIRADMDALPVKESTGLAYASSKTGTDRFGQARSIAHWRAPLPRRRDDTAT